MSFSDYCCESSNECRNIVKERVLFESDHLKKQLPYTQIHTSLSYVTSVLAYSMADSEEESLSKK